MINVFTKTLWIGVFFCIQSFADLTECQKVYEQLGDFLKVSDKPILFDLPPGNFTPEQLKLRNAINNNPQLFNALLKTISREDLLALGQMVAEGKIVPPEEHKKKLQAIVELAANDRYGSLWVDENSPVSNLYKAFPGFKNNATNSELGGTIAGVDTSSILSYEQELVKSALGQYGRVDAGNMLKRFFIPPYFAVKNVIAFHNTLRRQLDYAQEARFAVTPNLERANKLKLSKEEIEELNKAAAIIEDMRVDGKLDLEQVYMQDIITGGLQTTKHTGLYQLSKNINKLEKIQEGDKTDFVFKGEKAMDHLDKALSSKHAREGLAPRIEKDYMDTELKIRHTQANREFGEADARHDSALAEKTETTLTVDFDYDVIRTRTVTKTRTNSDGTTETYTEEESYTVTLSGTTTAHPSYKQTLLKDLEKYTVGKSWKDIPEGSNGVITGVSGKQKILADADKASEREKKYHSIFETAQNTLDKTIASHNEILIGKKTQENYTALQNQLTALEKLQTQLVDYLKFSKNDIKEQWNKDVEADFRQRNQTLSEANLKLQRHYRVYMEQLKREMTELQPEPVYPNYEKELNTLGWRAFGSIASQVLAVSSIAACEIYRAQQEKYRSCVASAWKAAFGTEKEKTETAP